MQNENKIKEVKNLYELLAKVNDADEIEKLFIDLCTHKEIEQMATRLNCACLLSEGNTYTQVIGKTDISSATLSRISSCIQYGEGYTLAVEKYGTHSTEFKGDSKK